MGCSSIKGLKKLLFCLGESIQLFLTRTDRVFYHWAQMNLEVPQPPAPGSRSVQYCLWEGCMTWCNQDNVVPCPHLRAPSSSDWQALNCQPASPFPRTENCGYFSTGFPSRPAAQLCPQPPYHRLSAGPSATSILRLWILVYIYGKILE